MPQENTTTPAAEISLYDLETKLATSRFTAEHLLLKTHTERTAHHTGHDACRAIRTATEHTGGVILALTTALELCRWCEQDRERLSTLRHLTIATHAQLINAHAILSQQVVEDIRQVHLNTETAREAQNQETAQLETQVRARIAAIHSDHPAEPAAPPEKSDS